MSDARVRGIALGAHRLFLWKGFSAEALRTDAVGLQGTLSVSTWDALVAGGVRYASGEAVGRSRLAIVAGEPADLRNKLGMAISRLAGGGKDFSFPQGVHYRRDIGRGPGKVAFMFSGQGSHRVGMVERISRSYPGAWSLWDGADAALAERLPRRLSTYVYPETPEESDDVALTQTDVTQPAIGTADMVLAHALTDLGVCPDMCLGHSYGELAALCAANSIGFEDLVRLSEARGRAIRLACRGQRGAMLAVAASKDVVAPMVATATGIVIANLNGPAQTVVSGREAEIDRLLDRCNGEGVKATKLNVGAAFHSPLVASAREPLRQALDGIRFSPSEFPVYANTTAEPHLPEPESIKDVLVEHLVSPVRFHESVLNMRRDGSGVFVEVGPGSTLASLARGILQGTDATVLAVDHVDGWFGLMNGLARLFVAGVSWSTERLTRHVGDAGGDRSTGGPAKALVEQSGVPSTERGAVMNTEDHDRRRSSAAAVERHQRLMQLFLQSQTRVMVKYLRGAPDRALDESGSVHRLEADAPLPAAVSEPYVTHGGEFADSAARIAESGSDAANGGDAHRGVLDRLRTIVAELTGYPPDMLDDDLDLEVDLGIDSIKRVEILVQLQEQSLLPKGTDLDAKAFSQLTTLSAMADRLRVAEVSGGIDGDAARGSPNRSSGRATTVRQLRSEPTEVGVAATTNSELLAPPSAVRSVPVPRAAPFALGRGPGALSGSVVIATDDRGLADVLADALPKGLEPVVLGGDARAAPPPRRPNAVVGYIHLGALSSRPETLQALDGDADSIREDLLRFVANLRIMEESLRSSRGFVLVATRLGGCGADTGGLTSGFNPLTGGHAGILKSISQEWPEVACRAVDIGPGVDDEALAGVLVDEVHSRDQAVCVVYGDRGRNIMVPIPSEPNSAHEHVPPLGEADVVLVTGGGRGITAEIALAMAERWRPTLVLVGRTVPGTEDSRYQGIVEEAALKREVARALAESGEPPDFPSIGRSYMSIVRGRELAENLRRMRATGVEVRYVTADVGDPAGFGTVLADVYRRYGKIDGVVHGAGVIEDRLIAEKDRESLERVLRPKVDGALTLVRGLRLDELRFLCFFSSTAAFYGNVGQSDYAAANETLNRLARWLAPKTPARVVSMNWGPWEPGAGMVDATLARRFKERGVALVTRDQGVRAFIDELGLGGRRDAEVIFG